MKMIDKSMKMAIAVAAFLAVLFGSMASVSCASMQKAVPYLEPLIELCIAGCDIGFDECAIAINGLEDEEARFFGEMGCSFGKIACSRGCSYAGEKMKEAKEGSAQPL